DRTGHAITTALREAAESAPGLRTFPKSPLRELDATANGWRARCGDHVIDAGAVVLAAGGRCWRVAEERGELCTNHPGATGEVTQIAADLGAELRDFHALPYMLRRYRAGGIDPLREPILTYPVLHYQNGGLVIDTNATTTIDGMYACGEIAGGTHGRNRMMGNSLLECCVFGRRAGRAAAEGARA